MQLEQSLQAKTSSSLSFVMQALCLFALQFTTKISDHFDIEKFDYFFIFFKYKINCCAQRLCLLKNSSHLSSWLSVKLGITTENLTIRSPAFPPLGFGNPLPSILIWESGNVSSYLVTVTSSPSKCLKVFSKPVMEST